ncbi:KAP-like P-loop domain-containing protein [Tamaricihabitans halophyticus]|uniref:KAP-like P-loop domain-containing protein n=1 Tax=Tamaricihabitans halophyticus TaxID=1262583 RepID=A0A4R2R443_9PSEU|nr:P-loop NTPase fold protein [Tamaricihabitans halophyticus]TCP56438.1 KAP-like P-loop domain-containing protein [Tamaricihabitans halophyticus]
MTLPALGRVTGVQAPQDGLESYPHPLVRELEPNTILRMPSLSNTLQPYLPREVDAELDLALGQPGAVLIGTQDFSGARRTAYEALLRNLANTTFTTNIDESISGVAGVVLWMDYHGRSRGALETDIPLLHSWLRGPGMRWIIAITDYLDLRWIDDAALAPLNPTKIAIRQRLTANERSALADRDLDDVETVADLYAAEQSQAGMLDDTNPSGVDDSQPSRHSPGYRADTDAGPDHLGISTDVRMLADLVASRQIVPPLSIGLFGSWGSGKSFFMRQMRERVDQLATASNLAERQAGRRGPAVSAYCSAVRQITFNAWHYAETDLWASLATHLFDQLAAVDSTAELRRYAHELAQQRQAETSLLEQLSSVRVERMLLTAQLERGQPAAGDASAGDPAMATAEFTAALRAEHWSTGRGIPQPGSLDEMREFIASSTGPRARLRNFGYRLLRSRVTISIALLGAITTVLFVLLSQSAVWPAVSAGITLLGSTAPAIHAVGDAVRRIRSTAERITERAEHPARTRLAELEAEQDRLEQAITELSRTENLVDYARSRGRTGDYQRQLSTISLLRRDLEVFAGLLAAERDDPARTAGLERIVLYVDDLDRCAPSVVVKTLEAIHLLLALPVFTIVVGVDAAWLRNALHRHYESMLDRRRGAADSDGAVHYLEKIFQIPFVLAPMGESGFVRLITELGAEPTDEPAPDRPPLEQREPLSNEYHPAPHYAAVPEQLAPLPEYPQDIGDTVRAAEIQLRPPRLSISTTELSFIGTLAPLIRTPRSTKRLINLYRLLRSRLDSAELADFLDGTKPPYRAALTLLAILVGPAAAAPTLFRAIESAPQGQTWPELLDELANEPGVALAPVVQLLRGEAHVNVLPSELDSYQQWLPLVRRFAFDGQPEQFEEGA